MEPVFRALADPTRRALLDELFRQDAQPLGALAARFDMTRVAVAKHLRLLEAAGLIVTRRQGREKLHYLNPVPIRLIHDRWVSKYTEGWAAGLADLKHDLEAPVEKVFEIYIRTTPERLWHAITDPNARARYQFGARDRVRLAARIAGYQIAHAGAPGALDRGREPRGRSAAPAGAVMRAVWDDEVASEGTSRVTWEIEPVGDSCRLTVVHDQLREDADEHVYGGWPMILSGLKTWLETGEQLTTPGSLMYGGSA